ncbi:MAG: VanZ family protein [Thermoleophilaceae bacterium]
MSSTVRQRSRAAKALRRLDPWAPPLLLMAVIFYFSAQPDLSSGLGTIDLIGRKIIHAAEYALLTFLWWRALAQLLSKRPAILAALAIAVAYGASDEFHQTFVSGRSGSPIDVAIDTFGAGVAALLLWRRG